MGDSILMCLLVLALILPLPPPAAEEDLEQLLAEIHHGEW